MKYNLIEIYLFIMRYIIGIDILDFGTYHNKKIDKLHTIQDKWMCGDISYETYIDEISSIKWLGFHFKYDIYDTIHDKLLKRYCDENNIDFEYFKIMYEKDLYVISEKSIIYNLLCYLMDISNNIMEWYIFDTYFEYKVHKKFIREYVLSNDKSNHTYIIKKTMNDPILMKYLFKYHKNINHI